MAAVSSLRFAILCRVPIVKQMNNNFVTQVTLFHWDLPQTLQDLGGWSNPKMISYFRDYSDICFREFGDKIKSWITFNEPYEICEDAYGDDKKAPAIDSHGVGNYLCSETLLKAHAESFHLYNESYRAQQNGRIMISINSIWYEPSDPENAEQVALAEVANQFKVSHNVLLNICFILLRWHRV